MNTPSIEISSPQKSNTNDDQSNNETDILDQNVNLTTPNKRANSVETVDSFENSNKKQKLSTEETNEENSSLTNTNDCDEGTDIQNFKQKSNKSQKYEEIPEKSNYPEYIKYVKTQVEYYFSNNNLRYDNFFMNRMQEAVASGRPQGSLEIKWLLGAPKLRKIECKQEDILNALKDSKLHLDIDESTGIHYIRRDGEIPALEKRPEKSGIRNDKKTDYHLAGCLIKIIGIPEEVSSWKTIKTSLQSIVPENAVNCIRFVSQIEQDGCCYIWCKHFDDDVNLFKERELEISGFKCKICLLTNEKEIKKLLGLMTSFHRNERAKEMARIQNEINKRPIVIEGQKFYSVDHLRKCIRDLLEKTEIDSTLKSGCIAERVLAKLVQYHPNSVSKLGGVDGQYIGIKIGKNTKCAANSNSNSNSSNSNTLASKCFYVIRKNKDNEVSEEDFSILKCVNELSKSIQTDQNILNESSLCVSLKFELVEDNKETKTDEPES